MGNKHRFVLRIDPILFKYMEKLAKKNRRSVNEEICMTIEEKKKIHQARLELSNT